MAKIHLKSKIEQIENLKLKDIETVGELIDILKQHKKSMWKKHKEKAK